MSGIFGIIRQPGAAVSDTELERMADVLKHRGPDGIHYVAKDNAGLGHCMLYSTPEALHEVLPFRNEAAGLTITADARIDNRDELMPKLAIKPTNGQVVTDSQLILSAFIKWGEGCVDHLLGDFAFAIWNEKAQSLFVARDHTGCKPFYYNCGEGFFVFASSAMAVASVPEVKATLNEGRVADYLVQELEGINKTCSWYNEITRMPPANCGSFQNSHFKTTLYWELEPADLSHLETDEDYLDAFTEVYTEAVRCRLRCNTEPASMLSGGLDSSTTVALARDLLIAGGEAPLRTYSGISEDGETCPETRCVEAIVMEGGLSPTCIRPSDSDKFTDELIEAMGAMEDPFDSVWIMLSLMFLATGKDGGRVLLSGLEGEAAVGAPTGYLEFLLNAGQWKLAWQEAKGFSQHYWRGHYSAQLLYFRALRSYLAPGFLRTFKKKLGAMGRGSGLRIGRVISREFALKVDLAARMREYLANSSSGVSKDLQAWQQHALQVPYLTAALERYERVASYFEVEVRHPLLDTRLLEFSAALPWDKKVNGGWSKYFLRCLANDRLPPMVAWREGWEQLGWMFVERHAQNVSADAEYLEMSIKDAHAFYSGQHIFDQPAPEERRNPNLSLIVEQWRRGAFYRWLKGAVTGMSNVP